MVSDWMNYRSKDKKLNQKNYYGFNYNYMESHFVIKMCRPHNQKLEQWENTFNNKSSKHLLFRY